MSSWLPIPLVTILTLTFPVTGLIVGSRFVADPSSGPAMYGLPSPAAPEKQQQQQPWIVVAGIKTATGALGLGVLALAGQTRAVGVLLLCGVLQAWADALVVRRYNDAGGPQAREKSVGHFAGGVVMLALGIWNLTY